MPLLVTNESEGTMLSNILNKNQPEDLDIRLFTNNHTPTVDDTVVDFTEATGGGGE